MEERQILKPVPFGQLPASPELPEGVRTVQLKDSFGYHVQLLPKVQYAERGRRKLSLELLLPTDPREKEKTWPVIVYVVGSAWMKQDMYNVLDPMLRVAERGYAVALVEYRHSMQAPFPAQVEDAKSAIRFLRNNAAEFHLDAERMALWGDSSGGHTVLMAALSEESAFSYPDDPAASVAVRCVVDWYGPTEIAAMSYYPSACDHDAPDSPEGLLLGGVCVHENVELANATNPANLLSAERETPPLLIMHGDSDSLVPFNQSVRLYEKMKALGKEVEFVKLLGADHGFGGFQSDEALDIVEEFLKRYL